MIRPIQTVSFGLLLGGILSLSSSCSSSNPGPSFGAGGTGNSVGGTGNGSTGGNTSGTGAVSGDDGDDFSIGSGGGSGGSASGFACESFSVISCDGSALTATPLETSVLLVLDKSGSMKLQPDANSTVSLWESVKTALETSLAEAPDTMAFGLELYPMNDDFIIPDNCGDICCSVSMSDKMDVKVAPGAKARAAILKVIGENQPGGGTPTAAALKRALDYFTVGEGKELGGQRFVMLATDGGPNCNADASCEKEECTHNIDGTCPDAMVNCCASSPDACLDSDGVLEQVEALSSAGIDTFIIGLDGTQAYASSLNQFAEAGGRPREGAPEKFYKVDAATGTADGLASVFREITTQLVKDCDVPVKDSVIADKLNVAVDCEVIPSADGPTSLGGEAGSASDGTSSWWFDDTVSPRMVRLQGAICDKIESEGVQRVDLLEGCDSIQ